MDLQQSISLQNLKNELNSVGVKAFTIDYLSQQISIINSDSIKDEAINCAVKKQDSTVNASKSVTMTISKKNYI